MDRIIDYGSLDAGSNPARVTKLEIMIYHGDVLDHKYGKLCKCQTPLSLLYIFPTRAIGIKALHRPATAKMGFRLPCSAQQ